MVNMIAIIKYDYDDYCYSPSCGKASLIVHSGYTGPCLCTLNVQRCTKD